MPPCRQSDTTTILLINFFLLIRESMHYAPSSSSTITPSSIENPVKVTMLNFFKVRFGSF